MNFEIRTETIDLPILPDDYEWSLGKIGPSYYAEITEDTTASGDYTARIVLIFSTETLQRAIDEAFGMLMGMRLRRGKS